MKGSRQARNIGTDRVAMTHSKAASQCPKTGGFASSHPTMWCQAGDHRRGCRTGGEWTSSSTTEVYVRVRSLSRAVSGARRREAAWWHITCAYKEAPEVGLLPPEASGYQPHPLARPAQHRGGTAARFEPIPVENGIKRGFSFSTGRRADSRQKLAVGNAQKDCTRHHRLVLPL
jgi:hypothetical protein